MRLSGSTGLSGALLKASSASARCSTVICCQPAAAAGPCPACSVHGWDAQQGRSEGGGGRVCGCSQPDADGDLRGDVALLDCQETLTGAASWMEFAAQSAGRDPPGCASIFFVSSACCSCSFPRSLNLVRLLRSNSVSTRVAIAGPNISGLN